MNRQTRLEALSHFLKNQRAKLSPQAVGLPAGTRRRTPGLRREEVAQLAGVSTTWYTWLEQGRDIKASASVLDCIAKALRLNGDERKYLYDLALEANQAVSGQTQNDPAADAMPEITPALRTIIGQLRYCPAIISDRRCRIVGWNDAAAQVFLNFERLPAQERNMIRLLFARKELRALAVNWEQFVGGFLAIFRSYYGQYVGDEWYEQFVGSMSDDYPEFAALWQQSRVSAAPDVWVEFRHAKAGHMQFHLTSLQVQGGVDLRCSIYTPVADSPTEAKMKRLMD